MAPIITAFTPSVLDVQTLEAMFVARQPLLDDLVATVHVDVDTGSRTHRLLIGPRGIGKTHLITLLDDRLRHDETRSGDVVVAWLREELWEVDTYLAFLEAVLAAIAPTSRSAPGYRDALISFAASDAERQAEDLLWSLVGDRLLVVLVENLDLLAENLGRDGQARLRAAMENRRQMSMIATTTTMPPDLYNSDAPFYGWFTPTHLDEFSLEEARELLIKVAGLRHDEELVEFLTGDVATARLRVVAELAGGSPRVWVLLSQCIDVESIDELVPLFIKMLDDLTPYYQERLRALAPQQRRIVMELCRRGGGVPVNELADSIRADQRSISSQLRTLERRGLVRKVELPDGIGTGKTDSRLSFYELREPLLRLALDVKESRSVPLGLVVGFLREWYGAELASLVLSVRRDSLAETYVRSAVESEVGRAMDEGTRLYQASEYDAALTSFDRATKLSPDLAEGFNARGVVLNAMRRFEESVESFDVAIRLSPSHGRAWNNRGASLAQLGEIEAAAASFRRATEERPDFADAWYNLGHVLRELGHESDALGALDRSLSLNAESVTAHRDRGRALRNLGRSPEAVTAFRHVVSLQPDSRAASVDLLLAEVGATRRISDLFEELRSVFASDPLVDIDDAGVLSAVFSAAPEVGAAVSEIVSIYSSAGRTEMLARGLTSLSTRPWWRPDGERTQLWRAAWRDSATDHPRLASAVRVADASLTFVEAGNVEVLSRLRAEERSLVLRSPIVKVQAHSRPDGPSDPVSG